MRERTDKRPSNFPAIYHWKSTTSPLGLNLLENNSWIAIIKLKNTEIPNFLAGNWHRWMFVSGYPDLRYLDWDLLSPYTWLACPSRVEGVRCCRLTFHSINLISTDWPHILQACPGAFGMQWKTVTLHKCSNYASKYNFKIPQITEQW